MSKILIEDQIVMKKIGEIKPYIRNPRKNDKTVELLCKVIPVVGFNVPILIDSKGVIIKGHARYTAAIRLGMEEVPCVISHADEEAIKADRITDNKISEFSEWVTDELLHEVDMLNLDGLDIDLEAMGIPVTRVDDIPLPDFSVVEEDKEAVTAREISTEERQRLYEEFLAQQAQMTTEKAIQKAEAAQKNVPTEQPKYYRVVCEKCGHVMYVREGDICNWVSDE